MKFQIAITAFIFSLNVTAAELLPFPDENGSKKQIREQKILMKFKNSVEELDCPGLKEVEDGLMKRISTSKTPSDRNYYITRLHIVIDTKINRPCG
jgi:hypothetical protein